MVISSSLLRMGLNRKYFLILNHLYWLWFRPKFFGGKVFFLGCQPIYKLPSTPPINWRTVRISKLWSFHTYSPIFLRDDRLPKNSFSWCIPWWSRAVSASWTSFLATSASCTNITLTIFMASYLCIFQGTSLMPDPCHDSRVKSVNKVDKIFL